MKNQKSKMLNKILKGKNQKQNMKNRIKEKQKIISGKLKTAN